MWCETQKLYLYCSFLECSDVGTIEEMRSLGPSRAQIIMCTFGDIHRALASPSQASPSLQ